MSIDVTISPVGNLIDATTAQTTINNNFAAIATSLEDAASLSGVAPNQWENNLDMNNFQILNLPNPATANSPLRLQDLNTFNGGGTVGSLPSGGTTGQVLAKTSNTDFAVGWNNSVTSVGMAMPSDLTVTGSPVTTTGVLTAAWATTPTGTGAVVRATSPTLVTPALGTPSSGVATNLTGTAAGLTAGSVSTNANLTGPITSTGNVTTVAAQTGTGSTFVMNTSPTLVTPTIGAATATSINKVTVTAPATASTLTIANGATLSAPSSATVSGTNTGDQTITLTGNVTGTGTGSFATTIAANAVTNAMHATMAANTIKANATSSSAVPTDVSIPALTQKVSPISGDMILIADSAASNALKFATVGSISSAGSVSSIAGNTGAFTLTKGITNSTNAIGLSLTNATAQQSAITSPTSTVSSTGVMMGLGGVCTITPTYSGRVKIEFIGCVFNTGSTTGTANKVYFGTGTAPTNGAAITGTQIGNSTFVDGTGAVSTRIPFMNGGIVTGLTPGTAYWFDLSLSVTGGSTGSMSGLSFNAFEF